VGERGASGAAGVVLASGAGTRVGAATNKVYLPVAGRSVVSWSLNAFARTPGIATLVLVTRPVDAEFVEDVLRHEVDAEVEVVHGGRTRQESELAALRHLRERIETGAIDTVLLHDGARPLVSTTLIAEVLRVAREHGGALPGLRADDIVALADGTGDAVTTPGTDTLVRAQRCGPRPHRVSARLRCWPPTSGPRPRGSSEPTRLRAWSGSPSFRCAGYRGRNATSRSPIRTTW
jgi:2-C-methyl-D-erythritol 4-phosphate cytidylyltransferase